MFKYTIIIDSSLPFVDEIAVLISNAGYQVKVMKISPNGKIKEEINNTDLLFIYLPTSRYLINNLNQLDFHQITNTKIIVVGDRNDYNTVYYKQLIHDELQVCTFLFFPLSQEEIIGNIQRYLK